MKNLFFWAQSLDNQSPDLIFQDDTEIVNQLKREEIIYKINKVPGKKIKKNPEIKTRVSKNEFIIEAIPIEKDEGDRLSPIVIYGKLPKENFSEWIEISCDEIRKVVADKLNRTLTENTLETINKWFTNVLEAKKNKLEMKKRIISIILASLTPLLVGWILQANGFFTLNPIEVATLIGLNNLWVMLLLLFPVNSFRSKTRTR